jgi:hypothetical protein
VGAGPEDTFTRNLLREPTYQLLCLAVGKDWDREAVPVSEAEAERFLLRKGSAVPPLPPPGGGTE